jgi:hypothetical protein
MERIDGTTAVYDHNLRQSWDSLNFSLLFGRALHLLFTTILYVTLSLVRRFPANLAHFRQHSSCGETISHSDQSTSHPTHSIPTITTYSPRSSGGYRMIVFHFWSGYLFSSVDISRGQHPSTSSLPPSYSALRQHLHVSFK